MSANPCGCDPEANHRCERHPDGHHRNSLGEVGPTVYHGSGDYTGHQKGAKLIRCGGCGGTYWQTAVRDRCIRCSQPSADATGEP